MGVLRDHEQLHSHRLENFPSRGPVDLNLTLKEYEVAIHQVAERPRGALESFSGDITLEEDHIQYRHREDIVLINDHVGFSRSAIFSFVLLRFGEFPRNFSVQVILNEDGYFYARLYWTGVRSLGERC